MSITPFISGQTQEKEKGTKEEEDKSYEIVKRHRGT
jgi:hypothetical protein